jgi:serine/threonine protein kinase/Tfp pilus assembly protein PilF
MIFPIFIFEDKNRRKSLCYSHFGIWNDGTMDSFTLAIEAYKQDLMNREQIQALTPYLSKHTIEEAEAFLQVQGYLTTAQIKCLKEKVLQEDDAFFLEFLAQKEETVFPSESFEPLLKTLLPPSSVHFTPATPERYQLLETLGEGGMGVVQLVYDQHLGREVALKKIKIKKNRLEQIQQTQRQLLLRFQREAEITATLEHPHIIPLYDLETTAQGEVQFTMRKVTGETLRELFHQQKKAQICYGESQWLSIFRKVCSALAYAHSKKVIHRDLKPENIMVGSFGEVYVMDWGIAKIQKRRETLSSRSFSSLSDYLALETLVEEEQERPQKEAEKTISSVEKELEQTVLKEYALEESLQTIGGMGTPGYMPPEQEEDASQVTPRSDIYALGKILKECFSLQSPAEEFKQHLKKDAKRLKLRPQTSSTPQVNLNLKIPEDILAMTQKATQGDPEKRYASVEEFLADLDRYEQHFHVLAKRYTFWETLLKWRLRYRIFLRFVLLLFLTSLGIIFYFYFQNHYKSKAVWDKAKNYIKALDLQEEETPPQAQEAIDSLLKALHHINIALSFKPQNTRMEQDKWEIGTRLSILACQTGDFRLAHAMVHEMEALHSIEVLQKKTLKSKVEGLEKAKLLFHQERFKYWQQQLQQHLVEGAQQESAVVELSKMNEAEMFSSFSEEIPKSVAYFLERRDISLTQEQWYFVLVRAFGRLGNPEAGALLLKALDTLTQHFSFKGSSLSRLQTDFLVELSEALSYSQAPSCAFSFLEIRQRLGQHSSFWERTRFVYSQLVQRETQQGETLSSPAEREQQQGILLSDQGKYSEALQSFHQALQKDPNLKLLYYQRANTWYALGRYEEAIADYTQALKQNPEHLDAFLNRGNSKKQQGKLEEALEEYQNLLEKNPQFFEAYLNSALIFFEQKKYTEALSYLEKASPLSPESPDLFFNRGRIREALGDREEALKDYAQALWQNPQMSPASLARGQIFESQGNFTAALLEYQQALRCNPQNFLISLYQARVHQKQGNFKEALPLIEHVLLLKPHWEPALFEKANLLWKRGELLHAQKTLEPLVQGKTPNPEVYLLQGKIFQENGLLPEALQAYQQALTLSPQHRESQRQLISFYESQDQKEEALVVLQRFLEEEDEPEIHERFLGLLLKQIRQCFQDKKGDQVLSYTKLFCRYASPENPYLPKVQEIQEQVEQDLKGSQEFFRKK